MSICSQKILHIPAQWGTTISSSKNRSRVPFNKFNCNDTLTMNCCGTRTRRSTGHHHKPCVASASASMDSGDDPEQQLQLREAREAISEFLLEFNISREEALFISSNSPKYLQMLVNGVRDLDELSLWKQFSNEDQEASSSFKNKILYLAKEKRDNGKFAFLESLGLSLNSAMNVARYLSSQPLPTLIHKVKYMKKVLFSSNDDDRPIGKLGRDMMMHLSIPIDDDLQQTLSIFEKIEAKRGGLNMLGSRDASFRYLVESFPRLLLLSVDSRIKPMVRFLKEIGVPQQRMSNVLLLFPPIMFHNIEVIKKGVLAFAKVGFVGEDVGKMLSKYPWILSASIQENLDEVLRFFEIEKVPRAKVEHAIRSWPRLLGCSTSKLELMMDQLRELGIGRKKLGQIISKSPQLLVLKPEEFLSVVSFFEDLGCDRETVGSLVGRCPEVFGTSIERTLKKKLQFLRDIGVPEDRFPQVIEKYPEFLVSDVDRTLMLRVKYLRGLGLSERMVASMVWRFSPLLGYSIEKVLKPKMEFLVNSMETPVEELVDYPRFFSYSLDEKIKPRFWVREGRKVNLSLEDMLGKNDEEFAREYMGIGNMFDPPSSEDED